MKSKSSLFILFVMAALTLLAVPVWASVYYVDGTTGGNGKSWNDNNLAWRTRLAPPVTIEG